MHLQDEVVNGAREILDNHSELLKKLATNITFLSEKYLSASLLGLTRIGQRYRNSVSRFADIKTENLYRYRSHLSKYSTLLIYKQQNSLNHFIREVRFLGKTNIAGKNLKLDQLEDSLPFKVKSFMNTSEMKLSACQEVLRLLDPNNVLQRGFTLSLQNNRIVKSANEVIETSTLETRFHDGAVFSQIIKNRI